MPNEVRCLSARIEAILREESVGGYFGDVRDGGRGIVYGEKRRGLALRHGIDEESLPHREFGLGGLHQGGLDSLVGENRHRVVVPVVSVPQRAHAMGQCGEVLVAWPNRVQGVQGDVQPDGVRGELFQLRDVIPPSGVPLPDRQVVVRVAGDWVDARPLGQSRLDLPFGHGPHDGKGLHAQRLARGEVIVQGVDEEVSGRVDARPIKCQNAFHASIIYRFIGKCQRYSKIERNANSVSRESQR